MQTLLAPAPIANPGSRRHGLRAPKGGCTVGGKLFKGGQFCLPFDPADPHGLEVVEAPAVAVPTPAKVSIHGFVYDASPISVAAECGSIAFELRKLATNNTYHILRDGHGLVTCDCPDYLYRREGTSGLCKHGSRLVELGMIPAPAPIPATPGRRRFDVEDSPGRIGRPSSRRFEPSPEEMVEAAQLFGDVDAASRSYARELAGAL